MTVSDHMFSYYYYYYSCYLEQCWMI